eukprot:393272-Pleurochrysis_carterae.AAC.2
MYPHVSRSIAGTPLTFGKEPGIEFGSDAAGASAGERLDCGHALLEKNGVVLAVGKLERPVHKRRDAGNACVEFKCHEYTVLKTQYSKRACIHDNTYAHTSACIGW